MASFYNRFRFNVVSGRINLQTDQFRLALMSPSFSFVSSHEEWDQVRTNEIAAVNGYTVGGKLLTNFTLTEVSGRAIVDCDDAIWTATGGSIGPARWCVLYSDTSAGDKLILAQDFGENGIAGVNTNFRVNINSSGLLEFN